MIHWVSINQRAPGEAEHTVVHNSEEPGSLRCELVVLSTTQVSSRNPNAVSCPRALVLFRKPIIPALDQQRAATLCRYHHTESPPSSGD